MISTVVKKDFTMVCSKDVKSFLTDARNGFVFKGVCLKGWTMWKVVKQILYRDTLYITAKIICERSAIFLSELYILIWKLLDLHGPPFKLAGFLKQHSSAYSKATDSCNTVMEREFF